MSLIAGNTATPEAAEKTRLLLAGLWRRNRPVIEERLDLLDVAAAADPMHEEIRIAALEVSHKLSGSLGMFGFEQGTLIARELESLLDAPHPSAARIAELAKELRTMLIPSS